MTTDTMVLSEDELVDICNHVFDDIDVVSASKAAHGGVAVVEYREDTFQPRFDHARGIWVDEDDGGRR